MDRISVEKNSFQCRLCNMRRASQKHFTSPFDRLGVYRNAIKILNASAIKSKASTMAKPTYHTLHRPPSRIILQSTPFNMANEDAGGNRSRNIYLWSPSSASAPITHILHFAAAFFLCLARVSGDVLWTISPVG